MILSASSSNGRTNDPASIDFLLEVTNQSSLVESRSKVNAMMKTQGESVNLSLGFVKSIVSGD